MRTSLSLNNNLNDHVIREAAEHGPVALWEVKRSRIEGRRNHLSLLSANAMAKGR